jgi:hypothetical protein
MPTHATLLGRATGGWSFVPVPILQSSLENQHGVRNTNKHLEFKYRHWSHLIVEIDMAACACVMLFQSLCVGLSAAIGDRAPRGDAAEPTVPQPRKANSHYRPSRLAISSCDCVRWKVSNSILMDGWI